MAEVSRSRGVTAEPAAIWAVLADFGTLGTWADTVDHSCLLNGCLLGGCLLDGDELTRPLGLSRRVQSGRDTFVETITAFEPDQMLAYAIAGVPRRFAVSNRWILNPSGARTTTVTLTSTVTWTSPVLRRLGERLLLDRMARRSEALLASLACALEGGS